VFSPQMGDLIANVVDKDGTTIIAEGAIEEWDDFHHWEHGHQFYVAGVNRY